MKLLKTISFSVLGLISASTYAQEFNADIQIRPRYEYTNGFGSLLKAGETHTSFVGQRSRVNLNYSDSKLKVKVALQNLRTWGDRNTIPKSDVNGVALFEGWAQYSFDENWSTKIGRQVISYDNQRIFGGLDWANQGRSHDAALITYKDSKNQLDLGFALNADNENKVATATPYTTDHKNLQYAWYHTNIEKVGISFLALNVGREYLKSVAELETNYNQTIGTYVTYKGKKAALDFSLYGQTGKIGANKVSAWNAAANASFALSSKLKATVGYEFLSGKDQNSTSTIVKSFNPLFGTNHAFNGFMDYFYVGNHAGSVGLQDISLKLDFPIKKVNLSLTPHLFYAPNKVFAGTVEQDSYLGTEVDLTAAYKVYKDVVVVAGYSQMFGSSTMEALKGGNADTTNNWAWVMVNINPQIFSSKK
ncbi:alginate export family protein [Flavobacterium algicola]|uniref:alginate export family protein n=1 Tax=Flavobacterium algicola TaxID=556529 RepID=UPI001EFEE796|nr:alginate export family protein [Flavobacterium algicola]MCG9793442.1 alginate export family protein [Flavobacterium algicola]